MKQFFIGFAKMFIGMLLIMYITTFLWGWFSDEKIILLALLISLTSSIIQIIYELIASKWSKCK